MKTKETKESEGDEREREGKPRKGRSGTFLGVGVAEVAASDQGDQPPSSSSGQPSLRERETRRLKALDRAVSAGTLELGGAAAFAPAGRKTARPGADKPDVAEKTAELAADSAPGSGGHGQAAAVRARRDTPTVSLKIPSFARDDHVPQSEALTGLQAVDRIIELARQDQVMDVCLFVGQRPMARSDGGFAPLAEWPDAVDERMIRVLASGLLEPAEKRRLQVRGNVSFAYGQAGGRALTRCTLFRQGAAPAALLRVPLVENPDPEVLGIPEAVLDSAALPGMTVVSGPPGAGRTETAFALAADFCQREKGLAVVVGRPVERTIQSAGPVLNLDVGRHVPGIAAAVDGALAVGASVLVAEDPDGPGVRALAGAAAAGVPVIVTVRAPGAVDAAFRLSALWAGGVDGRESIAALWRVVRGVVFQVLVPTKEGGRAAAFEILWPDAAALEAIQDGHWDRIGGRYGESVTKPSLQESLDRLVEQGKVDRPVADRVLQKLRNSNGED